MTRFIVNLTPEEALVSLSQFLDDLGYTWKINTSGLVNLKKNICIKNSTGH